MSQSSESVRAGARILGAFIDAVSWDEALQTIDRWARTRRSTYVCICNAHSVVAARGLAEVGSAIEAADMATPDGMPVAFMLRRLGFPGQERINGPDLMWRYCALASQSGVGVYFYGTTPATLAALRSRLRAAFPDLVIAGMHAPPFRPLDAEEDEEAVRMINSSGAGVVFVGLGCPKQELWMARHRTRIDAVMVGVGAAFDFHAGTLNRAPLWMQRNGLEWLHRLGTDPRRLWKRYLFTNTLFIAGALRQLWLSK
jgi:N-acetylglucosaminyldiphosphoundecaprenol N-acetyl-beta-D-mannosaminyltransferase